MKEYPTMIYKDFDDEEIKVNLIAAKYTNGTLYLGIVDVEYGELYADLTVNLQDNFTSEMNYLDTNNSKYVEEFITKYKLGEFTGIISRSGFCQYPLYFFNMEEIQKYCNINE